MTLLFSKKAFTFVELIVVITILAILGTIGFYSYASHISNSRDTKRISDFTLIHTSLKRYKQKKGLFPLPGNAFNILNGGDIVSSQGFLNTQVLLSTLETLPLDPKTKKPYFFSTTRHRQEYQIAATLENNDFPKALLQGNYSSVSKNTLPTIMLAHSSSTDIDITTALNKKLFIFNESKDNYPYDLDTHEPVTSGVDFASLLADAELHKYWQKTDFTNCEDIYKNGKSISNTSTSQEYQILTGGTLQNTSCDMNLY